MDRTEHGNVPHCVVDAGVGTALLEALLNLENRSLILQLAYFLAAFSISSVLGYCLHHLKQIEVRGNFHL